MACGASSGSPRWERTGETGIHFALWRNGSCGVAPVVHPFPPEIVVPARDANRSTISL